MIGWRQKSALDLDRAAGEADLGARPYRDHLPDVATLLKLVDAEVRE